MRSRPISFAEPPRIATGTVVEPRSRPILKRFLQLGFLFFLLKGVAWLVVAWLAWKVT
jgi:hypothetical protein